MKGFLKGIRYITQIFESDSEDEEEEEMQIGAPTDVKHVAHIGCDGPSVSSPSWMTDLKSEAKPASKPSNNDGEDKTTSRAPKGASQELKEENGTDKSISSTRGEGDIGQSKDQQLPEVPKRSRRRRSNHSSLDSTEFNDMSSETVVSKKSSRRHHSSDLSTMGGGGGGSTKPSRRNQNLSTGDANGLGHVVDTPSPLLPKSSTARNKKKSHQ